MEGDRPRLGRALGASLAVHSTLVAILLFSLNFSMDPAAEITTPGVIKYIHVVTPGPAGGGGGNPQPAAPAPIEIPRHQPLPAPVTPPTVIEPPPQPTVRLDAPVETDVAAVLRGSSANSVALPGPGSNTSGTGVGPGRGPGAGPGRDGGFGDGARHVGDGVSSPAPLRQVQPQYTSDAMRAKVQGSVTLEAVVRADGTVGRVRVVKSLDKVFGLDEEAVKAAQKWLFRPGTFQGKPTDVIVTLILEFRIH
jgi:periplasmic protein TonB